MPNKVAYLVDGTTAWTKAGFELEASLNDRFGPPSAASLRFAETHVQALAKRAGVQWIKKDAVQDWLDDPSRTTYLLDVRLIHEYEAGHLPGSVSAPGGQLLAVSHRTVAVRGARLVLIDDDNVRAITTAFWLQQRGWEVRIYENALAGITRVAPVRVLEPA